MTRSRDGVLFAIPVQAMCELLGVSSSRPVTATLSLTELAAHGGRTGPHKDGWGVAYYMGHDVRLLKDAEPAATSELVEFIEGHRFRSQLVIGHVRRRSRGRVSYANTHPFRTRNRRLGPRLRPQRIAVNSKKPGCTK